LSESLEDIQWDRVAAFVNGDQVGRAIEMILDTVDVQLAALAGAALLVSIVVLVWPARSERERQAQPTTDTDGGA